MTSIFISYRTGTGTFEKQLKGVLERIERLGRSYFVYNYSDVDDQLDEYVEDVIRYSVSALIVIASESDRELASFRRMLNQAARFRRTTILIPIEQFQHGVAALESAGSDLTGADVDIDVERLYQWVAFCLDEAVGPIGRWGTPMMPSVGKRSRPTSAKVFGTFLEVCLERAERTRADLALELLMDKMLLDAIIKGEFPIEEIDDDLVLDLAEALEVEVNVLRILLDREPVVSSKEGLEADLQTSSALWRLPQMPRPSKKVRVTNVGPRSKH